MKPRLSWILLLVAGLAEGLDNTLNGREKREIVFGSPEYHENPCNYTPSPKPDFSSPGVRLSSVKCIEHFWDMKRQEQNQLQHLHCYNWEHRNDEVTYGGGIGGRNTKPGEFPHMGAVGWRATVGTWIFKCGSSLISYKFLLTAAHCSRVPARDTSVSNPVPEIVRLGDKNIADVYTNGIDPYDVKIKRIVNHPNFRPPQKYFDIAIIELMDEVKFSKLIQPACLWTSFDLLTLGKEATITGWGVTETAGKKTSPELQAVLLDFIDSNNCNQLLSKYRNRQWKGLASHQLCAGKLAGGADSCKGDSGGPLQVKFKIPKGNPLIPNGIHYLVGVTSFGIRCAAANLPGVYTRIASFADWIEDVVWRGL
ncbi:serine protease snake [Pieris rapae]|uniref:serine protease snake n=1 Tax=Pieris rapae TaxID=64459 RepID=UPI001E27C382|nr:serine protease snake [Pieris rapae]